MDFLIQIFPGIFSALLGSYFSARWSIKKFHHEKWWERKYQAYTEIINSLYEANLYFELQKDDYGHDSSHEVDKVRELAKKNFIAYLKIKKTIDIGAFIISEKAHAVLQELITQPRLKWEENPSWEIHQAEFEAYQKALKEIVKIAKVDLSSKNNG